MSRSVTGMLACLKGMGDAGCAAGNDLDFPASATDALQMRFAAPVGSGPVCRLPSRWAERAGVGVRLAGVDRNSGVDRAIS